MADALLVFAVVFAVNLLPAFGPPTWSVLVALRLGLDIAAVPLVVAGALGAFAGLALFALSPVPSAQLFVAAGLSGARIVPLVLAFFSGRLVSYSFYVGAAEVAHAKLGDSLLEGLTSPAGIAAQLAMLALLAALLRVDWRRVLARRRPPHGGPTIQASS